ncbi:hypothetical protein SPHINGO8AM_180001 [Sphingomonas sp. 8AM]|nr:hypothetical protein SPHINGO8AM_180001 [Sphingomonas sp. 8AM]
MSRSAASVRDLTLINKFADPVVRVLTHVRRAGAKKVSPNRLTEPAPPRRGLFTDGAHH